jgi:signal transduction histidine kinase
MKHEIKKACLSLEISSDVPDSILLHGDVNSLVQVINNLITNAIQSYNGKTGEVVKLTASKNGTNLIISVIDTGSGISPAVKNKLFKSMITTKGKNGTGLGLFMSYSTIKGNFNGNITFDSELGKGTTFNIIIPIND